MAGNVIMRIVIMMVMAAAAICAVKVFRVIMMIVPAAAICVVAVFRVIMMVMAAAAICAVRVFRVIMMVVPAAAICVVVVFPVIMMVMAAAAVCAVTVFRVIVRSMPGGRGRFFQGTALPLGNENIGLIGNRDFLHFRQKPVWVFGSEAELFGRVDDVGLADTGQGRDFALDF